MYLKLSSVFYNSAALGDDFSCGEAGQLYSSDFTGFDETATLARFRLTALTLVHGGSQAQINGIINGALIGYHEAPAHQPTVVSGTDKGGDPERWLRLQAARGYVQEWLAKKEQAAEDPLSYLIPGRSGWPSAIPHTTYGDSVAATAAGIEAVVRTKTEIASPNYHGVITKQVLSGDISTGVEALSCIWSGQGQSRHRRFLNFDKFLEG